MRKIIEVEDILAEAQSCVECIMMAAETLDKHQREPIWRVADIASKKIEEAIAMLVGYRQAALAEVPDQGA